MKKMAPKNPKYTFRMMKLRKYRWIVLMLGFLVT